MGATCNDVMSKILVTLREEDNLQGVARAMDDFQIRHLPVVDGKKLVGMVSQRDILRLTVTTLVHSGATTDVGNRLEEDTFVGKIMSRHPATVRPETTLAEAARLLVGHRIGALAVVDAEGNLVGIVSEIDVLRAAEKLL